MSAPLALASDSLPLLHFEMHELMLPGEARDIKVEKADALAAVDAIGDDGLIGTMLITPQKSALATSTLLQVREVRRHDVGVMLDLVAVGRAHLGQIDHGRSGFFANGVEHRADADADELVSHHLLDALHRAAGTYEELRRKLQGSDEEEDDDGGSATLAETCESMRDELCAYDLDRAPADALERVHALWGVSCDATADQHLLSFAAFQFGARSSVERSLALGMESTNERLAYGVRCLDRGTKKLAAKLALAEAVDIA